MHRLLVRTLAIAPVVGTTLVFPLGASAQGDAFSAGAAGTQSRSGTLTSNCVQDAQGNQNQTGDSQGCAPVSGSDPNVAGVIYGS
jgi:hypothetical protein